MVHELVETAGWQAAAVTGAQEVIHGFGTHIPYLIESNADRAEFGAVGAGQIRPKRRADRGAIRRSLPTVAAAPRRNPVPQRAAAASRNGVVHPGEELPDAMRDLPYAKTIYLTFGTAFNVPQLLIQVVDAVRDLRHNVIVTTVQALIRRSSRQCRLILRLPLSCRRR